MSVWWSKNGHFPVVQVSLVHQSYFKSLDGLLLKAFHFQHESFLWTGYMRGVVLRHPGLCSFEANLNSTAFVDTNTAELTWPANNPQRKQLLPFRRSQAKQAEPEQNKDCADKFPTLKTWLTMSARRNGWNQRKTSWLSCCFSFGWFTWQGSRGYKP